jgi:mRNA-degrading endonuclease RelE of RelBE toxin-antitoxin system
VADRRLVRDRHGIRLTTALTVLTRVSFRRHRVGEIRVFYDVTGDTVEVLAIIAKSEVESWLARFGNPE